MALCLSQISRGLQPIQPNEQHVQQKSVSGWNARS